MTVHAAEDVVGVACCVQPEEVTELVVLQKVTGCGLTAQQAQHHVTLVAVTSANLTYWPPALCQCTRLSSINLSDNQLTFIPQSIQNLDALEVLNVSRNCLGSLPPELSSLTALTELDISRNHLSQLPAAMCSLSGLQVLNAMCNELTALPDNFGGLKSLIRLGLKSNKLMQLPESFCELGQLVELFITDNQLTTLPEDFGQLSSLVKLQASFNPFTHLPASLFKLAELEMFRLAVGQLQQWPVGLAEGGCLPKLAWCSLGSNPAAMPVKPLSEALPRMLKDELQIGQKLGAGASGEVFMGRYQGRDVAVKIFVAGIVSPDGCIQEEMGISCSIDHPHLTKVVALVIQPATEGSTHGGVGGAVLPLAAGGPGKVVGLVLELVHGKPLAAKPASQHLLRCKWAEDQVFSLAFVLQVLSGIASALSYLHSHGICHGDVYAHNILAEEGGHAVLCDFGASYCYPASDRFFEAMEVLAFGLLMQDLVVRLAADGGRPADGLAAQQLQQLVQCCLQNDAMQRPLFAELEAQLLKVQTALEG